MKTLIKTLLNLDPYLIYHIVSQMQKNASDFLYLGNACYYT